MREMTRAFLRTIVKIKFLLALYVIVLLVFAVTGTFLFTEEYKIETLPLVNFDNFGFALLTSFVSSSRENFPSILFPAINYANFLTVFFVVLFLVTFFVNILVLETMYHKYKQTRTEALYERRLRERRALHSAFMLLTNSTSPSAKMGTKTFTELIQTLSKEESNDIEIMCKLMDPKGEISAVISFKKKLHFFQNFLPKKGEFLSFVRRLPFEVHQKAKVQEAAGTNCRMEAEHAKILCLEIVRIFNFPL